MARYFIDISFDGTNYHGWQIQPGAITVQEKLQEAISVLLRYEVEITGAGRTDAGVHAKKMIAHFDYSEELDCPQHTSVPLRVHIIIMSCYGKILLWSTTPIVCLSMSILS